MSDVRRITRGVLDDVGIYLVERPLMRDFDWHWHEFYELEYVTAGSGTVYINDCAYPVRPHTLLFLSPIDFEKIEVSPSLTLINLAFSGDVVDPSVLRRLPLGTALYEYPSTPFDLLMQETTQNDEWRLQRYGQLVNGILIDIIRERAKTSADTETSPILQAVQYMQLHFKTPITLESISRRVGLSPCYFSALFSKTMHTTFKDYLTNLRLDYAARLLCVSDLSASEVGFASGFNGFSNFSRAFKKKFQCAPATYRNYKTEMSTMEASV